MAEYKKIEKIICKTLKRHLKINDNIGMEVAGWVIHNLNHNKYDIMENDCLSVKIHKEISRRIQEKNNITEDEIMGFIVEELNKFEDEGKAKKEKAMIENNSIKDELDYFANEMIDLCKRDLLFHLIEKSFCKDGVDVVRLSDIEELLKR